MDFPIIITYFSCVLTEKKKLHVRKIYYIYNIEDVIKLTSLLPSYKKPYREKNLLFFIFSFSFIHSPLSLLYNVWLFVTLWTSLSNQLIFVGHLKLKPYPFTQCKFSRHEWGGDTKLKFNFFTIKKRTNSILPSSFIDFFT